MYFKRKLLLLCISSLAISQLAAQSGTKVDSAKNYSLNPVWIKMMQDPNVNYFEAKKAFEMYWEGREEPEEEFISSEKSEKNLRKDETQEIDYAMEHKKFKYWLVKMKPYVKPNGTIMTKEEINALVNEELKRRQQDISK